MDHWCEPRIVVGRKLVELAILLRLVIDRRIVTTKEPIHRRGVPFCSKASEVLARHARLRLLYGAVREVLAKGVDDFVGCIYIVRYQGIAVQRSDLRRLGRACPTPSP